MANRIDTEVDVCHFEIVGYVDLMQHSTPRRIDNGQCRTGCRGIGNDRSVPDAPPTRTRESARVVPRCDTVVRVKSIALPHHMAGATVSMKLSP